jgi:hypothetical protein
MPVHGRIGWDTWRLKELTEKPETGGVCAGPLPVVQTRREVEIASSATSTASATRAGNHPWPSNIGPHGTSTGPEQNLKRSSGAVVALTFRFAVDDPARFPSLNEGAHGLVSRCRETNLALLMSREG